MLDLFSKILDLWKEKMELIHYNLGFIQEKWNLSSKIVDFLSRIQDLSSKNEKCIWYRLV